MITYRAIVPSAVIKDIYALLHAHWLELEQGLADGPSPNVELYRACEQAGLTVALGVFDGDTMVGYAVAFVSRHPHYDVTYAQHDSLFVQREYRLGRVAMNLKQKMEQACKERGAKFIAWHAKCDSPFDRLLSKMHPKEESVYVKEL